MLRLGKKSRALSQFQAIPRHWFWPLDSQSHYITLIPEKFPGLMIAQKEYLISYCFSSDHTEQKFPGQSKSETYSWNELRRYFEPLILQKREQTQNCLFRVTEWQDMSPSPLGTLHHTTMTPCLWQENTNYLILQTYMPSVIEPLEMSPKLLLLKSQIQISNNKEGCGGQRNLLAGNFSHSYVDSFFLRKSKWIASQTRQPWFQRMNYSTD